MGILLGMFVLFIAFGIPLLMSSMKVDEIKIPYSADCPKETQDGICELSFEVNKDIEGALIYYEIEDFMSSYRTFVDSKNYKQLRGKDVPSSSCHIITQVEDLRDDYETLTEFGARVQLDPEEVANPCGLIAQFTFSDTF